jgi:hypothetical protein
LTGDKNNCGGCGTVCPAKQDATAGCSSSTCVYTCKTGHPLSCTPNTNPSCDSWDFETATTEGWSGASLSSPIVTPHPGGSGNHSLAVAVNMAATDTGAGFIIKASLCGGSAFNIAGKKFHYWIMGSANPGSGPFGGDSTTYPCSTTNDIAFDAQGNLIYDPNDDTCPQGGFNFGDGNWKEVSTDSTIGPDPTNATDIGLMINLKFPGPWVGTVYIDDLELLP